MGPYGAVLADGSEYRGDYDLSAADLLRFHRERLAVLVAAGVEVLACETIPSLAEARVLVEAMSSWPELTAWVSFSARDAISVSDGTPVAQCAEFLDSQAQVVAVGVNCTPPQHISALLERITAATGKPVVVYPNSGQRWDPGRRAWAGERPEPDLGTLARRWYAQGARLVGGCCRTGPGDTRAIAAALQPSRQG